MRTSLYLYNENELLYLELPNMAIMMSCCQELFLVATSAAVIIFAAPRYFMKRRLAAVRKFRISEAIPSSSLA